MKISIVVPVYNEEKNIEPLAEQLHSLSNRFVALEILLVNDGSADKTWEAIEKAQQTFDEIRGIRLEKNLGQSAALLRGLHEAKYEVLAMLDGDLQNDPADIPRMTEALMDCDVVCGYREHRQDTWSRRFASRWANKARTWITRDGVRDTGCTLKIFRREYLSDLPPLDGMHRFMPAYFVLNGRRIAQVPVNHRKRRHGKSKYTNFKRFPHTLLDLIGFWYYKKRHMEF